MKDSKVDRERCGGFYVDTAAAVAAWLDEMADRKRTRS
jgi:hypothetical protein